MPASASGQFRAGLVFAQQRTAHGGFRVRTHPGPSGPAPGILAWCVWLCCAVDAVELRVGRHPPCLNSRLPVFDSSPLETLFRANHFGRPRPRPPDHPGPCLPDPRPRIRPLLRRPQCRGQGRGVRHRHPAAREGLAAQGRALVDQLDPVRRFRPGQGRRRPRHVRRVDEHEGSGPAGVLPRRRFRHELPRRDRAFDPARRLPGRAGQHRARLHRRCRHRVAGGIRRLAARRFHLCGRRHGGHRSRASCRR